MTKKAVFSAWLFVALYLGVIFVISSLPSSTPLLGAINVYHVDKILHAIEYAVLGFLLVRAVYLIKPKSYLLVIIVFALGGFYAVLDEWHQSFVPGRDASAYDFLADCIGLYVGAIFWTMRRRKSYAKD